MKTIARQLYKFQREGRDAALNAFASGERGFIIGDEMGLGKSIQALAVLDTLAKKVKGVHGCRFLIICPAFLKEKWQSEIEKFLPPRRSYSITITTYSAISDASQLLLLTRNLYELTILDEVHYVKDFASNRTRAVLGAPGDSHKAIIKVSKKVLGLSGTYPPNRVGEMYPFLLRVNHPLTQNLSEEQFLRKWATKVWVVNGRLNHKGLKNEKAFREALGKNIVRRTLDEVAPQVPKGVTIDLPVDCGPEVYKEETELLGELLEMAGHSRSEIDFIFKKKDFLDLLLKSVPGFDKLAEFRHRTGLLKIKSVFDYLKEVECKKFILFCYHKDVAEKYKTLFEKEGREVVFITGDVPAKKRFTMIQEAEKKPDAVLIATIDSVKEGYDMKAFTHSFFAEVDWRPYAIEQCQGRTRRIIQTKPVFWYFFTFRQGVERMIFNVVSEKKNTLRKIKGEA